MARRLLIAMATALAVSAPLAGAADLLDVWRAALQHDLEFSAADAAHRAGEARRGQGESLWRPSVQFTGTAGRMSSESATSGAQFSAPGFPQTDGVIFNTSINNGALGRWMVEARQPLISRERLARSRQLDLHADLSDLEWQNAKQTLMLTTAQSYFAVVLASESLRILQQQKASVERELAEARDRYKLGDVPVTDTYEASARLEAIGAQVLAAETELQLKELALSDVTGLQLEGMHLLYPASGSTPGDMGALNQWLAAAADKNILLRTQLIRTQLATEESAKFSLAASPTVDLVAQIGRDRLSGSGDFGPASLNSNNTMIAIQINVPLYTGGYRSARQEEALHLADKARADSDRTRQQIALQTRAAWLGLTVGAGRITALAEALRANRARLDATRLGRHVGDRTTLDLLNAENDTANAELALLQARVALLMDRLRLSALAGQLDETTLQAVNGTLRTTDKR